MTWFQNQITWLPNSSHLLCQFKSLDLPFQMTYFAQSNHFLFAAKSPHLPSQKGQNRRGKHNLYYLTIFAVFIHLYSKGPSKTVKNTLIKGRKTAADDSKMPFKTIHRPLKTTLLPLSTQLTNPDDWWLQSLITAVIDPRSLQSSPIEQSVITDQSPSHQPRITEWPRRIHLNERGSLPQSQWGFSRLCPRPLL